MDTSESGAGDVDEVSTLELDAIVMDYLVHYGHLKTVSALLSDGAKGAMSGLAPEQEVEIAARQGAWSAPY